MMTMTLGEALNLRADLQTKITQLTARLMENVKVQEGDTPVLAPQDLRQELFVVIDTLGKLVARINQTNNLTVINADQKLVDALIERENLMKKRSVIQQMIEKASSNENRYSMSEIKFVSIVDVAVLQKEYDLLSKQWRELDNKIQGINWITALI